MYLYSYFIFQVIQFDIAYRIKNQIDLIKEVIYKMLNTTSKKSKRSMET